MPDPCWRGVLLRDFTEYDRWFACMSPAQRARVSAYRHEADRLAAAAGEMLAKTLLSAQTGRAPDTIVLVRAPSGQPLAPSTGWHVSISHTRAAAFCAISRQPIGIDAELCARAISPAVARRCCTPAERQALAAAPDPQRRLLELWTAKEAIVKCAGQGLAALPRADTAAGTHALRYVLWGGHLICLCTAPGLPSASFSDNFPPKA